MRGSSQAPAVELGDAADAADAILSWGSTNDAACGDLASEAFKLSNTGAVSFDLEFCSPPACSVPTITLDRCQLDGGGYVYPRNGGAATHRHVLSAAPHAALFDAAVACAPIALSTFILGFLASGCRRGRSQSGPSSRDKSK